MTYGSGTELTDHRKVRYAVIGLAAMLIAVLLTMNLQRLPLVGAGTTYRAEFADAAGLVEGEEVRIAGIKVGQVSGIELGRGQQKGRVLVSFRVKGVDLGRDSSAAIEVKTLLGQHYLSVVPAGTGELTNHRTIPLARTSTPVNIVPAFQQLTGQIRDIDTDQVAKSFDALADTLSTSAPQVKGTLQGLSRLSRTITTRDDQVEELFDRARQVSGVVAARDSDIGKLLGDTATVLDILDQRRTTIRQIISGTGDLARQLTGLAEDNDKALLPALTKLNRVLTVLRSNEKQIDETIKYASVYGREFTNVGGSGRFFDATIKAPAGAGICTSSTGIGALLGLLTPILTQVNQAINGTAQPCIPLGPASGGKP
ncbi:MAG: hypothetical protein JWQ74_2852 [Marmoricola sp.]|nr:hypothetical protein [Marmoricola sp.]